MHDGRFRGGSLFQFLISQSSGEYQPPCIDATNAANEHGLERKGRNEGREKEITMKKTRAAQGEYLTALGVGTQMVQ
jgi:hypothetical protein